MYRIKEGLIFYTLGEEKSFPKYAGKQRSSKQKKKKKKSLINVTLIFKKQTAQNINN